MSALSLAMLRCVRVSRYSFLVFWMNVSAAGGAAGVGARRLIQQQVQWAGLQASMQPMQQPRCTRLPGSMGLQQHPHRIQVQR